MITGDLHYENITSHDPEAFFDAFERVHASPAQRRLFESLPIAYVWDDHDFGDNDSNFSSRNRCTARYAYRVAVPNYTEQPLSPTEYGTFENARGDNCRYGSIYQEFQIGRAWVVLTDNRSERDEEPDNLLTVEQQNKLVGRITDADTRFVIWVSSTPWICADLGSDNWGAYGEQREKIIKEIAPHREKLLVVSGDAHMIAIHDGTETEGAPYTGFRAFQAASLDRRGSTKNAGPFSNEMYPGGGRFGIVRIEDDGAHLHVELSGHLYTGDDVGRGLSFDVPAAGRDGGAEAEDEEEDEVEEAEVVARIAAIAGRRPARSVVHSNDDA